VAGFACWLVFGTLDISVILIRDGRPSQWGLSDSAAVCLLIAALICIWPGSSRSDGARRR
jgi:hypothetical protein